MQTTWLGRDASNKVIIKVGVSKSPPFRRKALNKSHPSEAFKWPVKTCERQ